MENRTLPNVLVDNTDRMEDPVESSPEDTDVRISKVDVLLWRLIFLVVILLGLIWIFPVFGRHFGERLNRLGLLAQVIGLISLAADVFKKKIENNE